MKAFTIVLRIPVLATDADVALEYGHQLAAKSVRDRHDMQDDDSRTADVDVEDSP